MILLQKLCAHVFMLCPFVLICKLLCHPPCTNFLIPEVLIDDRIYIFATGVQVFICISYGNLSVVLNQSMNCSVLSAICEVDRWPKQSSVILVLSFWNLSIHWYTFL
jgi:hypothetical protein